MNSNYYSIAIDGPAGAGKSTVAKQVAKILNIEYIDTGAMFRALTLKIIKNNIDPSHIDKVIELARDTDIDFRGNSIYLDGKIVDEEIRHNYVSQNVSYTAKIKEVRNIMLHIQRNMAKTKNVIMDGRDIGTVVLPNAKFKFFITATVEERARRRYKELIEKGEKDISLDDVISDIAKRDYIDSNREIAPLKQSQDAYLLDTTNKTIDEIVKYIVSIVSRG